jgi:transposase-like protein
MVSMNRLSTQQRARIVACLVESNSIRATCRMTGAAKNTVLKLLVDLGRACSEYQDGAFRGLTCKRIQCDEVWAFVYAKQKNVPEEHAGEYGYGDVYTWTAICADCKLVPSWLVGERNEVDAAAFIKDLSDRLAHRVQLTTDGHKPYLEAVESVFGADIDYAMLIKLYGPDPSEERRYSPPICTGTDTRIITGSPDSAYISTSYVERQNLTMRMGMRRFTRLTNAFSKKAENLAHAVSLHYMHYNFARVHQTLDTTPAIEAGVADHVWTLQEIAGLLDEPQKL